MRILFFVWLMSLTPVALAAGAFDVHVLGEVHDNPTHHAEQARRVTEIVPAALVFEMLTEAQAARALPELRGDPTALEEALGWAESGWPDFTMYYPVFAAAPEARILGAAVPRAAARAAMRDGLAATFGDEAGRYGLTEALPPAEQAQRETLQQEAHCGALPDEMLPAMVARSGVTVSALIASRCVTATTAACWGGSRRATTCWSATVIAAAARTGSRVRSGWLACPPWPTTSIRKVPLADMTAPSGHTAWPYGMAGQLCQPNTTSTGRPGPGAWPSSAPSAIISRAP